MDEETAGIEQPVPDNAENRGGAPGADGAGSGPSAGGISRGRKVRLAILVCVLVGLGLLYVAVRLRTAALRRQRLESAAEAVQELGRIVGELDVDADPEALRSWRERGRELLEIIAGRDPENAEAVQLAVPFHYVAGTSEDVLTMFEMFERVDQQSLPLPYDKCSEALQPFPKVLLDAFGEAMDPSDFRHVGRTDVLWRLARSLTRDCRTDADRALALCRWLAGHYRPEEPGAAPGDAFTAALRGYGSAAEAAWLYCELARQAGLRAELYDLGTEAGDWRYVVQVTPSGGTPILINPALAVPLLDPASGALLSREAVIADPSALARLKELGGLEAGQTPEALAQARAKAVCHPKACFQRFVALHYLLSKLPRHPKLALDLAAVPPDKIVEIWDVPVRIADQMVTPQYESASALEHGAVLLARAARMLQLQAMWDPAAREFDRLSADIAAKRREADVEEAVQVLEDAADYAAAFAAICAADAGDPGAAESLKRYLADREDGRWASLVRVNLADTLQEQGDSDGARAAWAGLPGARRLFGKIMAQGLWPTRTTGIAAE
jgi:hypothetical protein